MDTWVWVALALLVLLLVAVAAGAAAARRRRSRQLQEGFGPEYDRVVEESGDRREAERELLDRKERIEELDVRPLPEELRTRYAEEWRLVQARFVDEPVSAVHEADALVQHVMADRGYPVADDFERRAADMSVDHPDVVENLREGHRLVAENRDGNGDTEALRRAMVHFRSLFDELLGGSREREEVRT